MTKPSPRALVMGYLRDLRPQKGELRNDAVAGLPGAIGSVPDGMAASLLAGVSPVYGLYASFVGPIGGGLSTSTKLMVVTTTSAAALAAGSALATTPADKRPEALFLLTALAGALMIIAGVLRLGRYTRFVPHSVMIGFLTGVSINIVLGQIPDLLGYSAKGGINLTKAIDALKNISTDSIPSLLTGLAAMGLILGLARTRLAPVSALAALVIPTIFVLALGADSVVQVRDSGEIPQGIPLPHVPQLGSLTSNVILGAFSVALIVLVQGAGVAESAPNPDGRASDANRDFIGQGIGNVASGFFRGQPVGGSVGQTALNISSGARSRWAAIFSGVWMLLILVVFAGIVGKVALPTLSGLLIVAAIGSLRIDAVMTIWRTATISRVAMSATFLATLFLPVAAAVGTGLIVSLLLQLNREAIDLRVVELVPVGPGRFEEHPAPLALTSRTVTVLDVYGSLYYAGARTLQSRLPDPGGAESAAVILRLRGRTMVGATVVVVLQDYLERLRAGGGQLFVSGVDDKLVAQLSQFDRFDGAPDMHIVRAEIVVGESTQSALDRANAWLAGVGPANGGDER